MVERRSQDARNTHGVASVEINIQEVNMNNFGKADIMALLVTLTIAALIVLLVSLDSVPTEVKVIAVPALAGIGQATVKSIRNQAE